MKFVSLVLALTLTACGTDGKNGAQGPVGISGRDELVSLIRKIEKYEPSVIDIECSSATSSWRGTGFKTGNNKITTATHVLVDATYCSFWSKETPLPTEGALPAVSSLMRDITEFTVTFTSPEGQALPIIPTIKTYQAAVGDLLVCMSLPADVTSDVQYTTGFVTSKDITSDFDAGRGRQWSEAFGTDYAAAGGSSGAPVFNSDGIAVAVNVGGWTSNGLELNITLPIR